MRSVKEGSIKRDALLSETRRATSSQRRRVSEFKAREHVGAAGWQQTAALESILRAGREGLAATDALRQVVRLTTEQIRTLSLSEMKEQEEHVRALHEVVRNGEEQITAAQALEEVLCQALDDVARTPVDDVSVSRLKQIHRRVQEQVAALNTIVESAQVQARTLEQASRLEEISAEHQQRVNDIRQFSAEEEVQALGDTGQRIVERIAEIDEAHPDQLSALQKIGETLVESVPQTGADPAAQVETLHGLAEIAQAKAQELRGERDLK